MPAGSIAGSQSNTKPWANQQGTRLLAPLRVARVGPRHVWVQGCRQRPAQQGNVAAGQRVDGCSAGADVHGGGTQLQLVQIAAA
jgi:hypothetical protein